MLSVEKRIENNIHNQEFRKNLAKNNFWYFFHIYFGHYIKFDTAAFQKEMCELAEDWEIKFLEIMAFRGSAKSSIITLAFVIWCVITGKAHFPVIASDTFGQAKQHIFNLKTELELNELLILDWGPFEANDEWTSSNIVLTKYNARIVAKSTGQKMRGLRHKQYRPDLLIADDIESAETVRTKEQRDKDERWFLGEAISALDSNAKIILLGNLLHTDSIMMRIKKQIEAGVRKGVVREYPFLVNGKCLWPERFPTVESIENLKSRIKDPSGNPLKTWQREYLLKIVPDEGQVIKPEWIKYYDELPSKLIKDKKVYTINRTGAGVDLAISQKASADLTAMVPGASAKIEEEPKIFILPNIVNELLTFNETQNKFKELIRILKELSYPTFFVEDVGYQKAAIQEAERAMIPVRAMRAGSDKRARLMTVSGYVQNGTVIFPRKGAEDLIIQLTGFGVEDHDDLVDAFVYLVLGLVEGGLEMPQVVRLT